MLLLKWIISKPLIFPEYFTIPILKNGLSPEIQNDLQEKQLRNDTEEALSIFNTVPCGLSNQRSLLVTILCSWNKNVSVFQITGHKLIYFSFGLSFHHSTSSPPHMYSICVESSVKILPLQISGIFCLVSSFRQLHMHFCTRHNRRTCCILIKM